MAPVLADVAVVTEADQASWTCKEGHALVSFVTPEIGDCDRCGAEVSASSRVMDCRKCNWFLCATCHTPPLSSDVTAASPNVVPVMSTKPSLEENLDAGSLVFAKLLELEEQETNSEGRTVFTVEVTLPDGRTYRVKRAYNEFLCLRDSLEAREREIPFPPKRFRSVTGDRLVQRRRELGEWLQQAIPKQHSLSELGSAWQAFLSVNDSSAGAPAEAP